MKNKMTPGPWEASLNPIHSLNNDEAATIWRHKKFGSEIGSTLIAVTSMSPGYDEGKDNACAIVSAVNNTYGSGINPEAVPDLLSALQGMIEPFSYIGGVGHSDKLKAMNAAKAAIEKATSQGGY